MMKVEYESTPGTQMGMTTMKKKSLRKTSAAVKAAPKRRAAKKAAGRAGSRQPKAPNLYERLGGVYSIAAVVDDFIDRLMDDARLNANPRVDEAHHRVSRAGFKY